MSTPAPPPVPDIPETPAPVREPKVVTATDKSNRDDKQKQLLAAGVLGTQKTGAQGLLSEANTDKKTLLGA